MNTANEHKANQGNHDIGQEEFHAVPNGVKQKGGKGYGQCWECGEWGRPRRECPQFLERMKNKRGEVVALKGGGKKGKKGTGKGKGGKGTWNGGKGFQTYRYNYYNQSPGKAIGKG